MGDIQGAPPLFVRRFFADAPPNSIEAAVSHIFGSSIKSPCKRWCCRWRWLHRLRGVIGQQLDGGSAGTAKARISAGVKHQGRTVPVLECLDDAHQHEMVAAVRLEIVPALEARAHTVDERD